MIANRGYPAVYLEPVEVRRQRMALLRVKAIAASSAWRAGLPWHWSSSSATRPGTRLNHLYGIGDSAMVRLDQSNDTGATCAFDPYPEGAPAGNKFPECDGELLAW